MQSYTMWIDRKGNVHALDAVVCVLQKLWARSSKAQSSVHAGAKGQVASFDEGSSLPQSNHVTMTENNAGDGAFVSIKLSCDGPRQENRTCEMESCPLPSKLATDRVQYERFSQLFYCLLQSMVSGTDGAAGRNAQKVAAAECSCAVALATILPHSMGEHIAWVKACKQDSAVALPAQSMVCGAIGRRVLSIAAGPLCSMEIASVAPERCACVDIATNPRQKMAVATVAVLP